MLSRRENANPGERPQTTQGDVTAERKATGIGVAQSIIEHLEVTGRLIDDEELLTNIGWKMARSLTSGGKVLWFGNGGSAADCQHLAAELIGRFREERRALASIALTTDSSVLTAVGNDYGYRQVFRRQVEALCNPADTVVGISTSGKSENVILALEKARDIGAFTIGMTGNNGGRIAEFVDACVCIRSVNPARIQEAHILVGHILCDQIETHLFRS